MNLHWGLILVSLALNPVFGTGIVNLKTNYISEGVVVNHGYFMVFGEYKMFWGLERPIEKVYYGETCLFPGTALIGGIEQLLVEYFKIGEMKLVVITMIHIGEDLKFDNDRIHFELTDEGFELMDRKKMSKLIKYPVMISVDISSITKHPFLEMEYRQEGEYEIYELKVRQIYSGIRLVDGKNRMYGIGKVYDSNLPIIFSLTKVESFTSRCQKFQLIKLRHDLRLRIIIDDRELEYEKRIMLDREMWILTKKSHMLIDKCQKKALEINEKVDKWTERYERVTVDISENITPELMGLEKVTGTVEGWNYRMYQLGVKGERNEKIKYVVDTELSSMTIVKVNENALKASVEVYSNFKKSIVIVTTIVKIGAHLEEEVKVYEKNHKNSKYYYEVPYLRKKQTIAYMKALNPIKLDIRIRDPPTWLVNHGEIAIDDTEIMFFMMKEEDMAGNKYRRKYTFDLVWEQDLMEKGNIPIEKNKKRYKLLRSKLYEDKFIVTGSDGDLPIEGSGFETYEIIRNK